MSVSRTSMFTKLFSRKPATVRTPRPEARTRLGVEALEDRLTPTAMDYTNFVNLITARVDGNRYPHHGATHLYVNFDGFGSGFQAYANPAGPAQTRQDIQEILFRTAEIFAPFNVQVERRINNGDFYSGGDGSTTVFVGDDARYTVNGVNGVGGHTAGDSTDYPGGDPFSFETPGRDRDHFPNSDGHDVAFVDPIGLDPTNTFPAAQTPAQTAGVIAHEAGHTFGLTHVRTDGQSDPTALGAGTAPEVMSYTDSNFYFANQSFPVTDYNQTANGTKLSPDGGQHPKFSSMGTGFVTVTSQNSFSYLMAVLGSHPNDTDRHAAHTQHIDPPLQRSYIQQNEVALNTVVSGTLARNGDYDVYRRTATANEPWTVTATPTAGNAKPVVFAYDQNGTLLNTAGINGSVTVGAQNGQTYYFVVGSRDGTSSNGLPLSAGYQFKIKQGIFEVNAAGVLNVNLASTSWANDGSPDVVDVSAKGNAFAVTVNGVTSTFDTLKVRSLAIFGTNDAEFVTLRYVTVPTSYAGYGGDNRLLVDDTPPAGFAGFPGYRDTVTANSINRTGVSSVGTSNISTITFSNVFDVRLNLPAATNDVAVIGLPPKLSLLTLNAGAYAPHNTVTVDGTALSGNSRFDFLGGTADDRLVVRDNSIASVPYTLDSGRVSIPTGAVTFSGLEGVALNSVDVAKGAGFVGRRYTVAGWSADTPLAVRGGGGMDVIAIGGAHIAPVTGADSDVFHPVKITVDGGGGYDVLDLADYQEQVTGSNYTVDGATVSHSRSLLADLAVTYGGFETVGIDAGDAADRIAVYALPAGVSLSVNARGGNDTLSVGGTGVGNVRGGIEFNGGDGDDSVSVSDFFGPARSYTVGTSSIRGWGATVQYRLTENVSLTTGTSADSVTVAGTAPGTDLTVATGGGDDTVYIDLGHVGGPVHLAGGAGDNYLYVSDTNPGLTGYVITADALSSNSADVPAYYSGFDQIVVTGAAGSENFYVDSTAPGTRLTLWGREGYDGYYFGYSTGTLDGIQGAVVVYDTLGQGLVRFHDTNSTDPHAYTLGATAGSPLAFQRDGMANVDLSLYGDPSQIAFLYLFTGQGADAVSLQALPTQYYSVNNLTAGDRLVVGSDPTGQAGDLRAVHGVVDVHSTQPVSVIVDDSADATARDVFVGNGVNGDPENVRLVGLQAASMTFNVAAGSDVLVRGGRGNDRFRVVNDGAVNPISIDAGDGVDTLDYSWGDTYSVPFTGGVYVDLEGETATGLRKAAGFEDVVGSVGDDTILGNDADNLILGMGGNDTILGRGGDDILIGGSGNDTLDGGAGDDLLIGGATAYNGDFGDAVPLAAIQKEWSRRDIGYAEKVGHITGEAPGGLNGLTFLTVGQVDGADQADWLTGGEDADWFLSLSPIDVSDLELGERVG